MVLRRRSGAAPIASLATVPGLRRTGSLRFTLRRARDTAAAVELLGGP